MKAIVSKGYSVYHAGRHYKENEIIDLPEEKVRSMERSGHVNSKRTVQVPLGGVDSEGKPTKVEKVEVASRFAFDPDGLRGLDLDQLNVMIAERDPSVEPYESVEEATAHLSQDWVEPKAEVA